MTDFEVGNKAMPIYSTGKSDSAVLIIDSS